LNIDKWKTTLLPTNPPALRKKESGKLWSTNSSAPLLAAILKAYVCLCVCLSGSVHEQHSALDQACAAAAAACYLSVAADGWRVAAVVTWPVFPMLVCPQRLYTSSPCSAANAN